jgi:serine/threonine protein kinase
VQALLNNRYRVLEELGRGGFGQTFLAEDTHLPSRRRCVIKKLLPLAVDPGLIPIIQQRFEREAAILEELGDAHDQIPRLYAYFVEEPHFFLVQQQIEGKTLGQVVRTEGPLPAAKVQKLLVDLLPVLEFVHSKEIIHRDIKPENIILRTRDEKPVLIDFGAVKETVTTVFDHYGTASSVIFGSPGFMSFEQAAGRAVYSSDLYSLGWTAVYLLTGRAPLSFLDQRSGESDWRPHVGDISERLAQALDGAIQPHARDRYKSASEMLHVLGASNALAPTVASRTQPAGEQVLQKVASEVTVLSGSRSSALPASHTAEAGVMEMLPSKAPVLTPEVVQTNTVDRPLIHPKRRVRVFILNAVVIVLLTTCSALTITEVEFGEHDFLTSLLFDFVTFGLLLGLTQGALLRGSINPVRWIFASTIGAISARVFIILIVSGHFVSIGDPVFAFAGLILVPDLIRQIPTWVALRERSGNAWLWPVSRIVTVILFAIVSGIGGTQLYEDAESTRFISVLLPFAIVAGISQSICFSLLNLKEGQAYDVDKLANEISEWPRPQKLLNLAIVVGIMVMILGLGGMLLVGRSYPSAFLKYGFLIGLPPALIGGGANLLFKNGFLRWCVPGAFGVVIAVVIGALASLHASDLEVIAALYAGLSLAGVGISNAATSIMQGKKLENVSTVTSG